MAPRAAAARDADDPDDFLPPQDVEPGGGPHGAADSDAATLDSALRLIPPPLAAAARAAASSAHHHRPAAPILPPADDLHDFGLSWEPSTDFDDALFTQYLTLDTAPVSPPVPSTPPALLPDLAVAEHPSAPADDPMRLSEPHALAPALPTEPTPSTQPETSQPPPRASGKVISPRATKSTTARRQRSSPKNAPPKRSRSRGAAPPKTTPIPIAPRDTHRDAQPSKSHPATKSGSPARDAGKASATDYDGAATRPNPARSPASTVSRDAGRPPGFAHRTPAAQMNGPFPVGLHPHGMVPFMNMGATMYPLQHHQPMFPNQSIPAGTRAEQQVSAVRNIGESDATGKEPKTSRAAPGSSGFKKMRVGGAPVSADSSTVASGPLAHQQLFRPTLPVIPPGVMPLDSNMMPVLLTPQMYLAAAAAGYQQGVMGPMPLGNPNVAGNMFPQFPAMNSPASAAPVESPQMNARSTGESVAWNPPMATAGISPVQMDGSGGVAVEDGTQVDLRQQSLARREQHLMFGRLKLQNLANGKTATSAARPSNMKMTDTQNLPVQSSLKRPGFPAAKTASDPNQKGPVSHDGSSPRVEGEQPRSQKKRLVWTPELHERFVRAIDVVGLNQAVPKALVTIMNVEGLTTEHLKSHLQKYRNSLRKEEAEDSRAQGRRSGMSGSDSLSRACDASGVVGMRKGGAGMGVATNDNGVRQYRILPNRISLFGTPVSSSGMAGGGGSGSGTAMNNAPVSAGSGRASGALSVPVADASARASTQPIEHGGNRALEGIRVAQAPSAIQEEQGTRIAAHTMGSGEGTGTPQIAKRSTERILQDDAMLPSNEEERETAPPNMGINPVFSALETIADTVDVSAAPLQNGSNATNAAPAKDHALGEGVTNDATAVAAIDEVAEASSKVEVSVDDGADAKRVGEDDARRGEPLGAETEDGEQEQAKLEEMAEKTLQMQLMLQVMVYRTITLQKKIEQESSERMQTEASSAGVATSGRSTQETREENGDGKEKAGNRSAGEGSATREALVPERESSENGNGGDKMDIAREGRAQNGTGSGNRMDLGPKSELDALLQDQEKLGKVLEEQRAMLTEKRAEKEGRKRRGSGWSV